MHSTPIISFVLFGKEIDITFYGLFLALGFLSCLFIFVLYTSKRKISPAVQDFGFIAGIISMAIGLVSAILFQAVYNFIETGEWEFGALTVMGGLIGGAVCYLVIYFVFGKFYFKDKKNVFYLKEFNKILNVAPACIAIAHGFGRLGCLSAGCCHGRLVSSALEGGVLMNGSYYIPIQLYESIFLFILFAVLSVLYLKKCNITFVFYLFGYGIWRFIIEFFRTDYRGSIIKGITLTPSQIQSIVFVLIGVVYLLYFIIKKKKFFTPLSESDVITE